MNLFKIDGEKKKSVTQISSSSSSRSNRLRTERKCRNKRKMREIHQINLIEQSSSGLFAVILNHLYYISRKRRIRREVLI